jgi:predicted amidophosphoribosyltransferase
VTTSHVASFAWLVDLVFPQRCVACGVSSPSFVLCDACRGSLRPLSAPLCARCGAPTAWPVERCRECAGRRLAFASARAAYAYAGPAVRFIRGWKERGLRRLGPVAGALVADRLEPLLGDVVTSIPPDAVRQLGRGRHPAEALARDLASRWGLPYALLLGRARPTERQAALRFEGRRANVHGAFVARTVVPRRIVVVDDVYTTGATSSAAATALRRAGAHEVAVVTFARAIR